MERAPDSRIKAWQALNLSFNYQLHTRSSWRCGMNLPGPYLMQEWNLMLAVMHFTPPCASPTSRCPPRQLLLLEFEAVHPV